jgi:ACS family hexuronate transporter-like MFS transporter
MPWVFLVTMTDVSLAILLFSIAFFGQQSWSTLVMTLPADLFPRRVVGSVAGLVGFGGAMGGVAFNLFAGPLLDRYGPESGYKLVFAVSSPFHYVSGLVSGLGGFEVAPANGFFNSISRALDRAGLDSGYEIVFSMSSSFHILAFLIILASVRRVQPLKI